jgi:flagellar assembly factor FliW
MPEMGHLLLNIDDISFPDGLNGLSEYKHFKLVQTVGMMPIALLHSLDEELISFIVANPRTWFPFYRVEIGPDDLKSLEVEKPESILVLAIINVEAEPFDVTANLLAPLFINPIKKIGLQKIQKNSPYLARQPLTLKTSKYFFPEGLLGLPEYKNFVLHTAEELAPIQLLVCKEEAHISFPTVDPFLIDGDYRPKLSIEDRDFLKVDDDSDIEWRVLLNIQNEPFQVTANMMAPLAIHAKLGIVKQVVLSQSGYQAAFPIPSIDINTVLK